MAADSVQLTVKILDRDYQIACREDERNDLLNAAELVNERMRAIRNRGNVIGTDRVAVMTALNMAHELLAAHETDAACERIDDRVATLQEQVGAALAGQEDQ